MYNQLTEWVAETHHEEQIRQANRMQQSGLALPSYRSWYQRILVWLGDQMIAAGYGLHKRYNPPVCRESSTIGHA